MPRPGPVPDTEVIWPLIDAAAQCVPAADRGSLFADIAAGDYLPVVERLLRASLATAQPLPTRVITALDAWLDRYAGACGQPTITRLLLEAQHVATTPTPGPR